MPDPASAVLRATDPAYSASVQASAGTGKTWLLVTRMLRLLLAGTDPGELLAVTFTNKAAAEMQDRLVARARSWLDATDGALDDELRRIGMPADPAHRSLARGLYERLLGTPHPPRCSTFHAFCQDLLSRFPLESDVPPGFELLGNTRQLRDAAWDALLRDATMDADGAPARALDALFDEIGKPDEVRKLLELFLAHRSDWWAWQQALGTGPRDLEPAQRAIERHLGVDRAFESPLMEPDVRARVQEWLGLLGREPTRDVERALPGLTRALESDAAGTGLAGRLLQVLDTKAGTHRLKLHLKGLDAESAARIGELSVTVRTAAEAVLEHERCQRAAGLNAAWLTAGSALLERYTHLKSEQRLLDFDDLEWRACVLLNDSDNAHWVQYKLDRRISHLLVDEFQDTNPTQWRLLQPLLQELAAGDTGRVRSAFIVGDAKQSIYGFRRADPRLLETATAWMHARLDARAFTNPLSRRASPAVIEFVNDFCAGLDLPGFEPHSTVREDLWGRVEWLRWDAPGTTADAGAGDPGLRDPLQRPRPESGASRGEIEAEAEAIAGRVAALCDGTTVIERDGAWRSAGPGDCLVLVRKRTHLPALERALQAHDLPFDSDTRGQLLARLEVRDIVALLELLVAPWQGLLLAQVLKSPLFGLDDADLVAIAGRSARRGADWYGTLGALAREAGAAPSLVRAHAHLDAWRGLVDRVPVHDLLDRIYDEGAVLERYAAATPAHRRQAVAANLERVLSLALETDAGRYPTLPRFVERLNEARAAADEEYDDAVAASATGRVRIMTVHAAKGLEAPIVFVAQTGFTGRRDAWKVLVDWPADTQAPRLLRVARNASPDAPAAALLEAEARRAQGEEHNLLYVAVTRARQVLVLSGRPGGGWYGPLHAHFEARGFAGYVCGEMPPPPAREATPERAAPDAAGMTGPLPGVAPPDADVEDPLAARAGGDADAKRHGTLVHRAIERLLSGDTTPNEAIARESGVSVDDAALVRAVDEARRVIAEPALAWLFSAGCAWNEVPVTTCARGRPVHGVIDRLVTLGDDEVWVIDYKTHGAPDGRLDALRARYRPQLARYREIVQALWPRRKVRTALLFTADARLDEVDTG